MKSISRKCVFFLITIILTALFSFNIRCEENKAYNQALTYDFGQIEDLTDKKAEEYDINIGFKELLRDRLEAKDNSNNKIKKIISDLFFKEIIKQKGLLKNVIAICILSGIFKALTDSFKTKEISEIGFYVCYITAVMLLIDSFIQGLSILSEVAGFIADMAKAAAPVLTMALIGCGQASSGGVIAPLLAIAMGICLDFMLYIFIPGIKISAVISIVNFLGSKQMLSKMSEFITWILGLMLKIGSIAFMGIISLEKISSSALDNALSKTVQGGISAVPVIGDVFSGAAQSILGWSRLLKTGIGVSVVIVSVILSLIPIIKILIFMLLYKITAIIIEPFSDARLTGCIDTLGGYMFMILSGAVAVLIMFIFSIVVIISSIGG